jgi:hypothetical protein
MERLPLAARPPYRPEEREPIPGYTNQRYVPRVRRYRIPAFRHEDGIVTCFTVGQLSKTRFPSRQRTKLKYGASAPPQRMTRPPVGCTCFGGDDSPLRAVAVVAVFAVVSAAGATGVVCRVFGVRRVRSGGTLVAVEVRATVCVWGLAPAAADVVVSRAAAAGTVLTTVSVSIVGVATSEEPPPTTDAASAPSANAAASTGRPSTTRRAIARAAAGRRDPTRSRGERASHVTGCHSSTGGRLRRASSASSGSTRTSSGLIAPNCGGCRVGSGASWISRGGSLVSTRTPCGRGRPRRCRCDGVLAPPGMALKPRLTAERVLRVASHVFLPSPVVTAVAG